MSIFEIQGYNTNDGVLGFIAIPTFMFLDLMCDMSLSISSSEESASMWKQYWSGINLEKGGVYQRLLRRSHQPIDRDLRPSCGSRRNSSLEGLLYVEILLRVDRL
jgi:hypothetical protein